MFRYRVDDKIELELMNPFRADEIYELVKQDRDRLRKWLLWVNDISIQSINDFYKMMLEHYANKRAIGTFIIYNGKFAGAVEIRIREGYYTKYAEIGYWLYSKFEKKGVMTRSVRAIVDLGFKYLDINSAEIRCASKNRNSCNIAKKLGFKRDGILREKVNINGVIDDMEVWSILKREWGD